MKGSQQLINGSFSLNSRIRCKAAGLEGTKIAATQIKKSKNRYEMINLTTWLLQQEQASNTDAELAIVLSSLSLACKQIASLLQRSSVVNITGTQDTINIQGEDQKKLGVISNELTEKWTTGKLVGGAIWWYRVATLDANWKGTAMRWNRVGTLKKDHCHFEPWRNAP
ncbi:Fructose-1,6-bisphosphatase, chloroplastic [Capsicum baccatum]|uniref:Fructose-1,6-bisphosphatase, chloroplastic n=1 Tax=Capsicum baccatum TaxID=33114 RepID=A0A2G2VMD8_CAPBA|nr:Fructose-1,6-bisphosphatase, chloroplastic [Capsicum baccatum]